MSESAADPGTIGAIGSERDGPVAVRVDDAKKTEGPFGVGGAEELVRVAGRDVDHVTVTDLENRAADLDFATAAKDNDRVLVLVLLEGAESAGSDLEIAQV